MKIANRSIEHSGYHRAARPVKRLIAKILLGGPLKRLVVSNYVWILAFHRVDDLGHPDPLTCGIQEFADVCDFLSRTFRVVPLSQQLDELGGKESGGTLSITFDDGYRDNFENAAPILERFGLPATFFVATGFIGSDDVAWWDKSLPKRPEWMTWDQVRSLHSRGFEIGCHTVSHADLGSIPRESALQELEDSKGRLNEELGSDIDLFAYPYGGEAHMNAENLLLMKAVGFRCSLSCYGGVNHTHADPYALRRIPVNSAGGETVEDIAYHLVRNIAPIRGHQRVSNV